MRASLPLLASDGISRFPHKVLEYMHRVSDRAESFGATPYRRLRSGALRCWSPPEPSASVHGVGTPKSSYFAAQYLACTSPCQRFACGVAPTGA